VHKKLEAKHGNYMHLSIELQSSKSNDHRQKDFQNLPKRLPKLYLYYSTPPKKAIPIDSKIPTTRQSMPKAKQNELHQNGAYLAHLD
jgi:hypothetical protein